MNIEERNEFIRYRIETTCKTFDTAKMLATMNFGTLRQTN